MTPEAAAKYIVNRYAGGQTNFALEGAIRGELRKRDTLMKEKALDVLRIQARGFEAAHRLKEASIVWHLVNQVSELP